MITLFDVKLNKNYDFVQDTVPTGTGSWLVSDDFSTYTKGQSYNVVDGTPTRTEQVTDLKIERAIYPTIQATCEWLNNFFYSRRQTFVDDQDFITETDDYDIPIRVYKQYSTYLSNLGNYTFNNNVVTGFTDVVFITNDLVHIKESYRNNLVSYVSVTDQEMTLDNTNGVNSTENALILLMDIPQNVEDVISEMIYYDIYLRGNPSDLTNESIGNYSYSRDNTAMIKIGGIEYPSKYVSSLRPYKKVRFVQ